MADVIKRVSRGLPPRQRLQIFDQTDAGAGDVILVKDSLAKPASRVTIESVGGMTIRFNVYQTVFPQRQAGDGQYSDQFGGANVSQGVQHKDTSMGIVTIASGGTLELNDDMPINDIEIVSVTGDFTITCL
jgi:hypothetical protein